jgi:hypothetical protein
MGLSLADVGGLRRNPRKFCLLKFSLAESMEFCAPPCGIFDLSFQVSKTIVYEDGN